jgi:AraC-like DNA-binding protein
VVACLNVVDSFETLGAVQTPGMSVTLRSYAPMEPSQRSWTTPHHILTYRCTSGATLLTRQLDNAVSDFVPEGPLTYRPRGARWETISNGAALTCVVARFDDMPSSAENAGVGRGVCTVSDLSMIEMMRLLHDEIRAPGIASAAMIESIGEVLRIKLSRLSAEKLASSEPSAAFGWSEIALIHDYIEAQNGRSPSVTELAALFDTSRRSLLRRFRAATNMTVAAYITQIQLAKAKRLLLTSNKIIKEIAYDSGFRSHSNFSVAFERTVGMTPTAFRGEARLKQPIVSSQ